MLSIITTTFLKENRNEYNYQEIIGLRTYYAGSCSLNHYSRHDELTYFTEISQQALNYLTENESLLCLLIVYACMCVNVVCVFVGGGWVGRIVGENLYMQQNLSTQLIILNPNQKTKTRHYIV